MTAAAKKTAAKRARRPLYLVVRRLMDPETGEVVGAWVPANGIDQRLMRERGYRVGTEVRADMKKPRNQKFHRLAHALGGWLVDNLAAFEGVDSHGALKRLQREAGVCCESQEIDLGPLGKVAVSVPESLSFDSMEQGRFDEFWAGVTAHLRNTYASAMTDREWGEVLLMIDRDGQ